MSESEPTKGFLHTKKALKVLLPSEKAFPISSDVILVADLGFLPVVGNDAILGPDSADLVSAHTGSDLLTALLVTLLCLLRASRLMDASPEQTQGEIPVLVLRALVLDAHANTRRDVRHLDGRLRSVPVLSSSARATAGGPFDVPLFDVERSLRGLLHHSYGDSRSLDATLLIVRRDPLPAMASRFVLERLLCAFPTSLKAEESGALFD